MENDTALAENLIIEGNLKEKIEKKQRLPQYSMYAVLLLLVVMILRPGLNTIIAVLMLPLLGVLFFYDEFYILAAIFLFFGDQLIIAVGAPISRLFTLMIIAKAIFFDRDKKGVNVFYIIPAFVILMYVVFVISNADTSNIVARYYAKGVNPPSNFILNIKSILKYITDAGFMILFTHKITKNRDLFDRFCFMLVICTLMSGFYGFTAHNIFNYNLGYKASGAGLAVNRYMGSFNDPNYMSFFVNIAIIFALKLNPFKKIYIKIPVLILLYYFLVASGSITGLICNVVGLTVYVLLRYRFRAVPMLLVSAVVLGMSTYIVLNVSYFRNISVVQSMLTRIDNQFNEDKMESSNSITSGRTDHWIQYWNYYISQTNEKKLFGGNIYTTSLPDKHFLEDFGNVAHQAYIGFLLCFGLVGAIPFILNFLIKCGYVFSRYYKTKDELYLTILMCFAIWIFYGFGFDYFMDWRLMLFYFL